MKKQNANDVKRRIGFDTPFKIAKILPSFPKRISAMARDPRKHQKKKERRNKREKDKRKMTANRSPLSGFDFIEKAADAPFSFCKFHACAFDEGIGSLFICRVLPNGKSVFVIFLLDLFCLGVKDIVCNYGSAFEVDSIARKTYRDSGGLISFTPEEAKKLCDGAVSFAAKYGLSPHEDFKKAYAAFERTSRTGLGNYATAIKGDCGFCDLTMVRNGQLVFVELKRDRTGRVGPGQQEWVDALDAVPGVVLPPRTPFERRAWRPHWSRCWVRGPHA